MSKTELLFSQTRSDTSLDPAPLDGGSTLQDRVILHLPLLHNLLSHQELRVSLAQRSWHTHTHSMHYGDTYIAMYSPIQHVHMYTLIFL